MSFKVNGIDGFMTDLDSLANIPDDELRKMTSDGGKVIAEEIAQTGTAMGVKNTGQMLASIKVTKTYKKDGQFASTISPTGTRKNGNKTKSNTEIAYINNYGKKGEPARQFFTDGIAKSEDKAVTAAEKAYEDYLRRKNL